MPVEIHFLIAGGPLIYMALVVPLGFLLPRAPHYGGEMYVAIFHPPSFSSSKFVLTFHRCWLRYDTHFIWALISPVILIILVSNSILTSEVVVVIQVCN